MRLKAAVISVSILVLHGCTMLQDWQNSAPSSNESKATVANSVTDNAMRRSNNLMHRNNLQEIKLKEKLEYEGFGLQKCWMGYLNEVANRCESRRWWTFDDEEKCEAKVEAQYRQCLKDPDE